MAAEWGPCLSLAVDGRLGLLSVPADRPSVRKSGAALPCHSTLQPRPVCNCLDATQAELTLWDGSKAGWQQWMALQLQSQACAGVQARVECLQVTEIQGERQA